MAQKIGAIIPTIHGADKHTDRTRRLWIPASGMDWSGGGNLAICGENGGVEYPSGGSYYRCTTFKVPEDYASGGSLYYVWWNMTNTGDVNWYVGHERYTVGDVAATTISCSNDIQTVPGTSRTIVEKLLSAVSSVVKGDYITVRVGRLGAVGADTNVVDSFLYGIYFEYTADQ